jgi:hypothetical protein
MTFDPTKPPFRTRNGRPARIICTDRRGEDDPILALVDNGNGGEELNSYKSNGRYLFGRETEHDLVNVPQKRKRWLNIYRGNYSGELCPTRDEADANAVIGARIACIEIEFEEGEGLS